MFSFSFSFFFFFFLLLLKRPKVDVMAMGILAQTRLEPGNKTAGDGSFDLPDMQFKGIFMTCLEKKDPHASRIYSYGAFMENPLAFSLPVIMLQIFVITATTRAIYYLLRPIKQPRIVCDIIAGILIGPGVLGRFFPKLETYLFPVEDLVLTRTLAAFGLMFYLFLIGVKMDPKIILQSGKKALFIGLFSAAIPFMLVGATTYFLRKAIGSSFARGNFLIFIVASLTITAFPVLADILNELHLINSELGRLALSCAMVHGVFGWFFMALFIVINQSQGGIDKGFWALASLMLMVGIIVFAFRPWMQWIARRTPKGRRVSGVQLSAIILCVIGVGLLSEMLGASFVDGPLILGLVVPEGPPVGTDLVERIGNVASEVMMPLLFAVAGAMITPEVILYWRTWLVFIMLLLLAYGSKLVATIAPAIYCGISLRKAFVLGLMMNFQGVVELVTYINFWNGTLLDNESYTLLVLSILIATSVATPLVKHLYNPLGHHYMVGQRAIQHLKPNAEIRMLACMHNEEPIPSIIGLIEASCPVQEAPACVYVLHLVDLAGRTNSTLIAHRNNKGFINPSNMDRLHNAFINYEQDKKGLVTVQPFTAITPFKTMHQDICSLASEKSVALIILPLLGKDSACGITADDQAFRSNIPHILSMAPCSVGLLVHKGMTIPVLSTPANFQQHIGLLFWGGPDDREALAYAARMVRHSGVRLTVTRFVSPAAPARNKERQERIDNEFIETLCMQNSGNERASINEVAVKDMEQTIAVIHNLGRGNYDLVIVGRRISWNSMLNEELEEWSEFPELGLVGDMMASSDLELAFPILVVQQRA